MDFKILNASTAALVLNLIGIFDLIFIPPSVEGQRENARFTSQEIQAIAQLRSLVSDILYKDCMQNDWYLMIWLRATFLDVAKTEKMLRKSYKYRKENNIDDIVSDKSYDKFTRDLPYKIGGRDREGRPILVVWFGLWNVRKYVLSGKSKEFDLYFTRANEMISQLAKQEWNNTASIRGNRMTPEFITLADLAGYNLREGGCLACLPRLYQLGLLLDSYYPDMANIYLLNNPRIFESVLAVVLPLVSQRTRNSLVVHGLNKQEWTDALHKVIEPEQFRKTLQRPKF